MRYFYNYVKNRKIFIIGYNNLRKKSNNKDFKSV